MRFTKREELPVPVIQAALDKQAEVAIDRSLIKEREHLRSIRSLSGRLGNMTQQLERKDAQLSWAMYIGAAGWGWAIGFTIAFFTTL